MFKKQLALFIIFVMILVPIQSFADETLTEQQVNDSIKTINWVIRAMGTTDKTAEGIYLDALTKLSKNDKEKLGEIINSMLSSIDEYSRFYNEEETKEFMTEMKGATGGIGVMAQEKNGYILVVGVIENSPAEKSGIKPGDLVVAVDDKDVYKYSVDQATSLIRGEIGTNVTITIRREGIADFKLKLVRESIELVSVESTILDGNIGYLRLVQFTNTSTEQVKKALEEFKAKDVEKLILDLRYNGGGTLEAVTGIADLLIAKDKPIYIYEEKNQKPVTFKTKDDDYFKFDNTVMLVNEYSASASELLTGCLQDNKVAKIVGVTTYGKGSVQTVMPFSLLNGAIRLTIAHYKTPLNKLVDKVGVTPDYVVKNLLYNIAEQDMPKFAFERRLSKDMKGEDVKELEKALQLLNYNVKEPDEVLDEGTADAIAQFQQNNNLYSYGVADFTTQNTMKNKLLETKFTKDLQIEKALELLK